MMTTQVVCRLNTVDNFLDGKESIDAGYVDAKMEREIPQSPRMTLVSELSDLGLVQKALNSTAYHCILKPSIILKQQRYTEKGER